MVESADAVAPGLAPLETAIAQTRARLTEALAALESEARGRLDPLAPPAPRDGDRDATAGMTYALAAVRYLRALGLSTPAVRVIAIAGASTIAAVVIRARRRASRRRRTLRAAIESRLSNS